MANELFCYEQAARKADERGAVPALWAQVFADTAGEPNRARARYKKLRQPTLGGGDPQGNKIAANALARNGTAPRISWFGLFAFTRGIETHQ